MASRCIKFEVPRFNRSKDISLGVKFYKIGHVTLTTPLSGMIRHRLVTVNLCTKFEVPNFTRYEVMEAGAKCIKYGGLEWL